MNEEPPTNMKISVVMAAYNSQATIGTAIASFLEQDHPDKELIVIDGASSDATCEIVRGFASPFIRLQSGPDNGIYDAMNKGLRMITGDAFGCLNSDDRYHDPKVLCRIADALYNADLVSGRLHFVREHGSPPVRVWQAQRHTHGVYARGFTLPHPTSYARRRVLDRVGEFCTAYSNAGDYDWLLRALEVEGFSHHVIQDVIVDMRIGGESTSGLKAIIKNSREMLEIRRHRLGSRALDKALFLNLFIKLKQVLLR